MSKDYLKVDHFNTGGSSEGGQIYLFRIGQLLISSEAEEGGPPWKSRRADVTDRTRFLEKNVDGFSSQFWSTNMIIDTDTSCLGKHDYLRRRGIFAVGRYYSQVNTYKNIGGQEALELSQNGIDLFVVYEDHGARDQLALTEDTGKNHAQAAVLQAQQIGQPAGSVIYFAVEGLPNGYTSADLPGIRSYFKGVTEGLNGLYVPGVYGDGIVCETLLNEGVCKFTWLAQASYSFERSIEFYASKRWNVAQIVVDLDKDKWQGLSVDINETNGDFGSFRIPVAVA
jgi:hypothetical protein